MRVWMQIRERGHSGGLGCELHPFAALAIGEFGGEQPAGFQEVPVVAALDIAFVADEAVYELAPLVVAHIDHDPPVGGEHDLRVLVLEAAERGPLLRRRRRIERVDLDDIARAVGLVGMPGDIEPLVRTRPRIAPVLQPDTVALEGRTGLECGVARREIEVEILLAGEMGAPRRAPVAAIVPGAEAAHARGIGGGPEQSVAARGTGYLHRRVGGDPPVVGRVPDDRPATAPLRDLDDRHPVPGLALAHVVGGPGLAPGVDDRAVHILVVDDKHVPAAIGEQRHAVIVVAEGAFLALPGAARLRVEVGPVRPHRIAPSGDDVPAVTLWDRNRIQRVGGNGIEPEPVAAGERRQRLQRAGAGDEGSGAERHSAKQSPPRESPFRQTFEIGLFGVRAR